MVQAVPQLAVRQLDEVGDDVSVRQLHALRQARSTRAVHEEGGILLGVEPRAAGRQQTSPRAADLGEVLELAGRVPRVAEQDDAVLRQADDLGGFDYRGQHRHLRHDTRHLGVLHLEGQLLDRVGRVRRRARAAGPEHAEEDRGVVDIVGREESQDVALLEAPLRLESPAELNRRVPCLRPCVRSLGVGVDVYLYRLALEYALFATKIRSYQGRYTFVLGELSIFPFE